MARGDDFLLATPDEITGTFAKEVKHILESPYGYRMKVTDEGTRILTLN